MKAPVAAGAYFDSPPRESWSRCVHDTALGLFNPEREQQMFEGLNYTRNPEQLAFHAQTAEEFDIPTQYANTVIQGIGMRPEYRSYSCGACRNNTT
jgi:hypothetical protein